MKLCGQNTYINNIHVISAINVLHTMYVITYAYQPQLFIVTN